MAEQRREIDVLKKAEADRQRLSIAGQNALAAIVGIFTETRRK